MTIILGITIYVFFTLTCAGFILADLEADYPSENKKRLRQTIGFCVGISLIPATWFLCPFMTGFFVSGWKSPLSFRRQQKGEK